MIKLQSILSEMRIVSTPKNYLPKLKEIKAKIESDSILIQEKQRLAIEAAKLVLPIWEVYHKDDRPRLAIQATEECLNNPTEKNKEKAREAANAATDAADTATTNAAYYAAYAAAYAAYSVNYPSIYAVDYAIEATERFFKINIKEISATSGGITGATFTSGVGEQYATPKAFSKKGLSKKKYEVFGYKTLPKKTRFKAKSFDIANWKNNKSKYLKEANINFDNFLYEMRIIGNIIQESIKLFKNIIAQLKEIKLNLLSITIKDILNIDNNFTEILNKLYTFQEQIGEQINKVDDILEKIDSQNKINWEMYNTYSKLNDMLESASKIIDSFEFLIDSLIVLRNKFNEDRYYYKEFKKI